MSPVTRNSDLFSKYILRLNGLSHSVQESYQAHQHCIIIFCLFILYFLSSSREEDRYIDPKTKVHTFHFQDSLPQLPIPKLEDTCHRYLDAQKPLLTPEQYEETKGLVEKFQKRDGPGTVVFMLHYSELHYSE